MPKEEAYYWPVWFSEILNEQEKINIKNVLPKIQAAQIFLWRALNIYDDFFDGLGKPIELSKANKYFRDFLEIHYRLDLSNDYYDLFKKIFNNLDKTNQLEISSQKLTISNNKLIIPTKLPKNKTLTFSAKKSLALALGSLALLFFLGDKKSNLRIKSSLNFWRYALSAKQLADDSQDWLEDLKAGLITNANILVLRAAKNKKIEIDFKKRTELLYLLFAEEAAPIIIKNLKNLCRAARKEMAKINPKFKITLLDKLILPIEKSCSKAEKFTSLIVKAP
jgi:hypothetical protein